MRKAKEIIKELPEAAGGPGFALAAVVGLWPFLALPGPAGAAVGILLAIGILALAGNRFYAGQVDGLDFVMTQVYGENWREVSNETGHRPS